MRRRRTGDTGSALAHPGVSPRFRRLRFKTLRDQMQQLRLFRIGRGVAARHPLLQILQAADQDLRLVERFRRWQRSR